MGEGEGGEGEPSRPLARLTPNASRNGANRPLIPQDSDRIRRDPVAIAAWPEIRRSQFRRQRPIGPFVVDFFAASHRLIVEMDGPIHDMQQDADHRGRRCWNRLGCAFCELAAATWRRSWKV